jgi:hypothetical protein
VNCPRCGGRLLIGRPDNAGSDISCLACGHTPQPPSELAKREVARLDDMTRGRQPSHKGQRF